MPNRNTMWFSSAGANKYLHYSDSDVFYFTVTLVTSEHASDKAAAKERLSAAKQYLHYSDSDVSYFTVTLSTSEHASDKAAAKNGLSAGGVHALTIGKLPIVVQTNRISLNEPYQNNNIGSQRSGNAGM